MTTVVLVLRVVSVLALAGLVLLAVSGRGGGPRTQLRRSGRERAPLVANFAAVAVYLPALVCFPEGPPVSRRCCWPRRDRCWRLRARPSSSDPGSNLGPRGASCPRLIAGTGLVTSGPYRLVRHPIYLGFVLLAMGEALAFGSWPALVIALAGIVPTFAWRARAEEQLLGRSFGERYAVYRARTRLLIPYLL